MRVLLFLLISLYASSTWSQDFVCGFGLEPESESGQAVRTAHNSAFYRNGTVRPIILFGEFDDAVDRTLTALWDRDGVANQRADSLLSVIHEGSLAHYFSEMSYGDLTLAPPAGGINLTWYESQDDEVSYYVGPTCNNQSTSTWSTGVRNFVREVIGNADASIDFSDSVYDRKWMIPQGATTLPVRN